MKRAAAILGPTPPFIRWAIEVPCPFLRAADSNSSRNPAQTRWRQLRSLKEIARAKAEGRVHSGYCFASEASAEHVLGIHLEEVTAPMGGTVRVAESCQQCLANPNPLPDIWAPCTGILPLIPPRESLTQTQQAWVDQLNALNRIVIAENPVLKMTLSRQQPLNWYHIWHGPALESERLQVALSVLKASAAQFPLARSELAELEAALEHSSRHSLKVWIEAIPVGWSDGQVWQLPAHCRICGSEWLETSAGACGSCGCSGGLQNKRQLKVLGLRPFIQLSHVLGSESARQLFEDYQSARRVQTTQNEPHP